MSFPAALVHQLYWKPPYPTADFTGKTVIVTGANVGLGKEAVKHFVRLNAKRVIATARSLARGQPAKDEIEAETKRDGVVELWELDYSKYASVKAFGARAASLPRIDALVLNASMATRTFEMLEDNESTITVNVISTALLTLLLLPTLQLSATKYGIVPVLTTVSSGTHAFVNFSEHKSTNIFETINNENTANMEERYPLSKLLQIFAVREMAERTRENESVVIINTLDPGLCQTELARNTSGLVKYRLVLIKALFAWTAEQGSRTLVHGTIAGKESHGIYITGCMVKNNMLSGFVTSEEGIEAQKKYWKELVGKLETIQPGVTSVLS